jgi:hypothetical protein
LDDGGLSGDLMLHRGDQGLGFRPARELPLRDGCRLSFRGCCRFLGGPVYGEKSLSRRFVLETLPFLLRGPFRGESRRLFRLETLPLFPLFPRLLLFGGPMDGLFLVHHFLKERLAGLFRAAPSRHRGASVTFLGGYHHLGGGDLLRQGSLLASLQPDHPLQLDGGVLLDGARGGFHPDLELGLEELDGLRAALSQIPGQLVDSYLIH